ncbi:MAG: hypothetical protein ACFCUM_13165 [Bacteroidales bacterium]
MAVDIILRIVTFARSSLFNRMTDMQRYEKLSQGFGISRLP